MPHDIHAHFLWQQGLGPKPQDARSPAMPRPANAISVTDPAWVTSIADWHENEARLCRAQSGPSSQEYAGMHELTAEMLWALLAAR